MVDELQTKYFLIRKQNFDGIVLDQGYIALRVFGAKMYDFLIALAQKLHDNNKVLILVVPVSPVKPYTCLIWKLMIA